MKPEVLLHTLPKLPKNPRRTAILYGTKTTPKRARTGKVCSHDAYELLHDWTRTKQANGPVHVAHVGPLKNGSTGEESVRANRERARERKNQEASARTKRERVHPLVREWTHANSMNDMNMCAPTASSHMWANTCALMAVVVAGFVLVHFWERQAKKWERGERASDLPCEWNMWSTDCTQRPEPGPGDLWVGLMLGGKGTVMLCGVKWWRRQAVSSGNWFLDFFETAYNIHLHHFV